MKRNVWGHKDFTNRTQNYQITYLRLFKDAQTPCGAWETILKGKRWGVYLFNTHYLPHHLIQSFLPNDSFPSLRAQTHTARHNTTQHTNSQSTELRERGWPRVRPRQRDGQTDRKRESGRVYLRTDGELGQSAAQPLRDCLQLFQLRLLTPALLAQDLVLQPLVTLSKTQHTCSKTQPCSHRCAAAPVSPGPAFKQVTLSPAAYCSAGETQLQRCCLQYWIFSSLLLQS